MSTNRKKKRKCSCHVVNLTNGDVDGVAAVSVFGFAPVHAAVGLFGGQYEAGGGLLVAPAITTLGENLI